ncbi:kinase-like domain-containing protein [Daldinia caldariorum]|uniref:kinase-like domain-containing protein n=1 Tax=Daldinia caldariorum TaxID=326644 RepID=UPI0020072D60|nr:kinase-like domain-containing protein [Daldinia caldariorum]KAI1465581.1 kinase-like domain-containing protein [Daldinia caldariorum]
MLTQLQLPTVPEEVTASWLTEVLKIKVKSAELKKVLPGTATKLYISIQYEDDKAVLQSADICVKGGFNPAFIEQVPWVVMIFQREVEFFNRVAPSLGHIGLPKVWWAGYNSRQGIVMMDDLSQKCEFGRPTEAWTVARALSGVEQLAALHASTWGVKPEDYPWLTSDYDQAILVLMQTFDEVVNGPDRPVVHGYLKDQKRVTEALKKHYALRNPKFRCLLHGDPHTGNTYLENGAPRFLDWQMIHIGSAFHDVAYFIGGALSIEDRRTHEYEILDHYLATLEKLGGPKFSRKEEDVLQEYRKSFLAGIGWIMCPYEMQLKDCVDAMARRYSAALDDHKTLELVESLPDV